MAWRERGKTSLRTPSIVGTIKGVFNGALDGTPARLIRTWQFGYMVELLASKGEFHQGDHMGVSVAEFEITPRAITHDAPGLCRKVAFLR